MDHHTTTHEAGEGGSQAVCSCGWRKCETVATGHARSIGPPSRTESR